MFKKGDIITAIDNYYCFTNKRSHYIGKVVKAGVIKIRCKTLFSTDPLEKGDICSVGPTHFKKLNEVKEEGYIDV